MHRLEGNLRSTIYPTLQAAAACLLADTLWQLSFPCMIETAMVNSILQAILAMADDIVSAQPAKFEQKSSAHGCSVMTYACRAANLGFVCQLEAPWTKRGNTGQGLPEARGLCKQARARHISTSLQVEQKDAVHTDSGLTSIHMAQLKRLGSVQRRHPVLFHGDCRP